MASESCQQIRQWNPVNETLTLCLPRGYWAVTFIGDCEESWLYEPLYNVSAVAGDLFKKPYPCIGAAFKNLHQLTGFL